MMDKTGRNLINKYFSLLDSEKIMHYIFSESRRLPARMANALLFMFLFVNIVFPSFAEAEDKEAELQWKEVDLAYGYQVEIKDKNERIVLDRVTKDAYLNFYLPGGSYKGRISVLNKFQKVSVRSKWFDVKIVSVVKPLFVSISRAEFKTGSEKVSVEVKGDNFQNNTVVSFKKGFSTVEAQDTVYKSQQALTVILNMAAFEAGYYDIIITNPGGVSVTAEKKIFVGQAPVFISIDPSSVPRSGEETSLVINGDKFDEECAVFLEQKGKVYKPSGADRKSAKKIIIKIVTSDLSDGEYDLIISNTKFFTTRIDNCLKIVPPNLPVINSVSPMTVLKTWKTVDIHLEGDNFIKGCRASLLKDGTVIVTSELNINFRDQASFQVVTSKLPEGQYRLKVTTPDNTSVMFEKPIEVLLKRSVRGAYVGISAAYNIVMSEWNETVKNSYMFGSLYGGYDLPFFNSVQVVKDLGAEINLYFMKCEDNKKDELLVESDLRAIIIGLGVYYRNSFGLPADIIIRGGGGMAYSTLLTTDTSTNTKNDYVSIDPLYYMGFSARKSFFDYFFVEAGSEYQTIMYINRPFNQLHSFLRVGIIY